MGLHLSIPIVGCSNHGKLLLMAAGSGRLVEVKQILEEEPGLASYSKPLVGTSALHAAAAAGRADIVEELLGALSCSLRGKSAASASRAKHKVVNLRNLHGQTPLMLACKAGSRGCVRALLRAGADPTLFDSLTQSTCLHYAAKYGWPEVVEELLGDGTWVSTAGAGRRTLLREAVMVDSQGSHKYVDGRASLGLAPLHLSAAHGHVGTSRALIMWGASVSARCNLFLEDGQGPWVPYSTPLHLATAKGDYATTLALLTGWAQQGQRQGQQPGPDPRTIHDFWDRRPFDVARSMGHMSLLVLLSPSTSLVQLIEPQCAVPSLASLATDALKKKLGAELKHIAAHQAQQAQRNLHRISAATTLHRFSLPLTHPAALRCPVCLGEGSAHGPLAAALGGGGALQQQCWQLVAAAGCRHALCMSCAHELCQAAPAGAPVRCPLCRALVGAWEHAPAYH